MRKGYIQSIFCVGDWHIYCPQGKVLFIGRVDGQERCYITSKDVIGASIFNDDYVPLVKCKEFNIDRMRGGMNIIKGK